MARAEEYRRYAAECLALAQRALNPNDRARLLEMANAFNELAAKAEAENDQNENSNDDRDLRWRQVRSLPSLLYSG